VSENWREITRYPGYEVSDLGRVRGWRSRGFGFGRLKDHPSILKSEINHAGYARVPLNRDGRQIKESVHRLVLDAFVGPCPSGHESAHANGDRSDNRLANLRWATHEENCKDKFAHGTQPVGELCRVAILTASDVRDIRKATGPSHVIAAKYGVSSSAIRKILNGKNWNHV
jgi:hypothetical protein